MAKLLFFIVAIFLAAGVQGFAGEATDQELIQLPEPKKEGSASLEQLLVLRKSIREFNEDVPSWSHIGQLLWAAQGINRPERGGRTAPSAWAKYPLELFVILPQGVYQYIPKDHAVKQVKSGDVRNQLGKAGLSQSVVHHSTCVFVLTADFRRMIDICETLDDALRYTYLEAGHAAQNLLLQLIPLGMGGCPIGANINLPSQKVIGIPEDLKPVYILATGYPK